MKYGFGIDLGGTTVKIAYFDEEGTLLDKWEIPTVTADGGSAILPDIAASVNSYLESKQIRKDQIIGIGIGVPGPVDKEGTVNKCVNLGWGVINIPKILGGLTGLAVTAGNDANVAALGEAWKGGGQGCNDMVFATLGTGVGGGIVIGGEVVHGVHGAGGEIGHITLNRYETDTCGCGKRGCAEQYCSATGIVRIAQQFMATSDADSSLRSYDPLTCKDVFDAAKAGDPVAAQVFDQYVHYLCVGLVSIINMIDPEMIVLGGGVSGAGQFLLDAVRTKMESMVFYKGMDYAKIELAVLGNDAGIIGAAMLGK